LEEGCEYTINYYNPNGVWGGAISLEGYDLYHPASKFTKVTKTTKSDTMKTDAYIDKYNVLHTTPEWGEVIVTRDLTQAYKYNLMSKEEFEKKHKKPLRFAGYDVEVGSDTIHVGCKHITKEGLRGFLNVCRVAEGYTSPKDIYSFLQAHKQELGL
jgi:hypothetical protein